MLEAKSVDNTFVKKLNVDPTINNPKANNIAITLLLIVSSFQSEISISEQQGVVKKW